MESSTFQRYSWKSIGSITIIILLKKTFGGFGGKIFFPHFLLITIQELPIPEFPICITPDSVHNTQYYLILDMVVHTWNLSTHRHIMRWTKIIKYTNKHILALNRVGWYWWVLFKTSMHKGFCLFGLNLVSYVRVCFTVKSTCSAIYLVACDLCPPYHSLGAVSPVPHTRNWSITFVWNVT